MNLWNTRLSIRSALLLTLGMSAMAASVFAATPGANQGYICSLQTAPSNPCDSIEKVRRELPTEFRDDMSTEQKASYQAAWKNYQAVREACEKWTEEFVPGPRRGLIGSTVLVSTNSDSETLIQNPPFLAVDSENTHVHKREDSYTDVCINYRDNVPESTVDIDRYFNLIDVDFKRHYSIEMKTGTQAFLKVEVSQRQYDHWDFGRVFTSSGWSEPKTYSYVLNCKPASKEELNAEANRISATVEIPALYRPCN